MTTESMFNQKLVAQSLPQLCLLVIYLNASVILVSCDKNNSQVWFSAYSVCLDISFVKLSELCQKVYTKKHTVRQRALKYAHTI